MFHVKLTGIFNAPQKLIARSSSGSLLAILLDTPLGDVWESPDPAGTGDFSASGSNPDWDPVALCSSFYFDKVVKES